MCLWIRELFIRTLEYVTGDPIFSWDFFAVYCIYCILDFFRRILLSAVWIGRSISVLIVL